MDCAASSMMGTRGIAVGVALDGSDLSEEIHGHDRTRAARHDGRCRGGIETEGVRLDIREHGLRAGIVNGARRREERERRGDHLVASSNVEGAQCEQECVGAVRAPDREARMRQRRDLALEILHRLAKDEGLIIDDFHHGAHDVVADARVLGFEIEKGNRHQVPMGAGMSRRA